MEILFNGVQAVSGAIWGVPTVAVMMCIGAVLTVQNRFLQFRHTRLWLHETMGQALHPEKRGAGITRAQALATALAGTMGVGNIAGVAAALSCGGPGALFWMWGSALFGMMIKYAETVLAVRYRRADGPHRWVGGPMEVLEDGLHCPALAICFAAFCVMASFGMGNMTQANAVAQAMQKGFHIAPAVSAACCAAVLAVVIFGGLGRIARVAEALIPALTVLYCVGGVAVIALHIDRLVPCLAQVVSEAFSLRAAAGGTMAAAMRYGFSHGIFSNEAGLGSSAMVYAAAEDARPVEQGFWGIFEVFADTIVVCTITGFAILTSGVSLAGETGAALTIAAFETTFGRAGGQFIAASIALFAFASMLGWAYYGERGATRLGGSIPVYRVLFAASALLGGVLRLELVWGISEIFNGLMSVPNLIAVVCLAPQVRAETDRWFAQREQPALPPFVPGENRP